MKILADKTRCINNDEIFIRSGENDDKVIHEDQITKSDKSKRRLHLSTHYDDSTVRKNCKGLGYKGGKKKEKETYLDKDPTILYLSDINHTKSSTVLGILKNGNFSDLRSTQIDKKMYTVTNTCAFDSIFQIICSSYVDSNIYANWVNYNVTAYTFFELIANASRNGINSETYKKRACILQPIVLKYKPCKETSDGLTVLDSSCTANYLLQKLFEKYPSYMEERECLDCGCKQTRSCTTLIANLPTENIHYLTDVLKMELEYDKKCTKCRTIIKTNITPGNHLFIEPVLSTIEFGKRNFNFDLPVILKDIPTTISIFDTKYTLRGLINFIPPKCKSMDAVGHYVSYNWREGNNDWERCDDLLNTIRHVRASTTVNCQFIIYTL